MYIRFIILSLSILLSLHCVNAQKSYKTSANAPGIKTLKLKVNGSSEAPPVIGLHSDDMLQISFDEMGSDFSNLSYRIIHCNADWRQSALSELEYIDGFNNQPVDNPEPSFNTFTPYYHYSVNLPNDQISIKSSGNYAIEFYRDNDESDVVATATFYADESSLKSSASVSSNTDIDFNREHQQVSLRINTTGFNVSNPSSELKIIVMQNGRRDNMRMVNTPSRISSTEIVYEHNRNLIFEAGNNFRRFDISSVRYPGIGVEALRLSDPFYHAFLIADNAKAGKAFFYDRHQSGRFVVNSDEVSVPDTESEYVLTHFTLEYPYSTPDGNIYIAGEFNNYSFDKDSEIIYNFEKLRYEKTLLLKQGHYNYQYLFLPFGAKQATTSRIEGNYFETSNQYQILIYYRPQGARYDRLISTIIL